MIRLTYVLIMQAILYQSGVLRDSKWRPKGPRIQALNRQEEGNEKEQYGKSKSLVKLKLWAKELIIGLVERIESYFIKTCRPCRFCNRMLRIDHV